jgi:hypothetical protein
MDDLADQIAKCGIGDEVQIKGHLKAYDTSKLKHRGGYPFLEIELSEIVEWRKTRNRS